MGTTKTAPRCRASDVAHAPEGETAMNDRYYTVTEGREHISSLFNTRAEAEDAVSRLETLGVHRTDISVILRNNEQEPAESATTATTGITGTDVAAKAGEG